MLEVLLKGILADVRAGSDGRDGSFIDDCAAVCFGHDCSYCLIWNVLGLFGGFRESCGVDIEVGKLFGKMGRFMSSRAAALPHSNAPAPCLQLRHRLRLMDFPSPFL